jgi:hypothetical protein
MRIVLSFREEGPAYDRVKAVVDVMGLSVQDYLPACIVEGHKLSAHRHRS